MQENSFWGEEELDFPQAAPVMANPTTISLGRQKWSVLFTIYSETETAVSTAWMKTQKWGVFITDSASLWLDHTFRLLTGL